MELRSCDLLRKQDMKPSARSTGPWPWESNSTEQCSDEGQVVKGHLGQGLHLWALVSSNRNKSFNMFQSYGKGFWKRSEVERIRSPPKCARWNMGCLVCVCAQSCLTPWDLVDCSPPGSPVMGFCRQECWSVLPWSLPGDLPDPGIKPESPVCPAEAGGVYHWDPWEIPGLSWAEGN